MVDFTFLRSRGLLAGGESTTATTRQKVLGAMNCHVFCSTTRQLHSEGTASYVRIEIRRILTSFMNHSARLQRDCTKLH